MTVTKFEGKLNRRKGRYFKLQQVLDEFLAMNIKVGKVTLADGEYKSVGSAASSLKKAVGIHGGPVRSFMLNDCLYLERTDMDD